MSFRGRGRGRGRGEGRGRGQPDAQKGPQAPELYPPLRTVPEPPEIDGKYEYYILQWRELKERLVKSPYYLKQIPPKKDVERYSEIVAAATNTQPTLTSLIKQSAEFFPPELLSSKLKRAARPNDATAPSVRDVNLEAFAALEKEEQNQESAAKAQKKGPEKPEGVDDQPGEEGEEEAEEEEQNDYTANYEDDDEMGEGDDGYDEGPTF